MVLTAGIGLLLVALLLWLVAARWQRQSDLPYAPIRYDDAGVRHDVERPLVAHRYRLTGRPDYLLDQRAVLIPVELKPLRRAAEPYESDLLQLAAYCLLVEETYGARPPYGILKYAAQSWQIPFDDLLRQRLLATLQALDEAHQAVEVFPSHNQPARCTACSQRSHCTLRLDD